MVLAGATYVFFDRIAKTTIESYAQQSLSAPVSIKEVRSDWSAGKLNIDFVINQGVGELSGGQQQRLSIARVLTKKPKIIFADEPTGNLDKETAQVVMNTLQTYIEENSAGMILVTHENELAMQCDKVYKLENLKLQELK